VEDANNALANELEINFNMLCAIMMDEVGGEVDRTDVVAVYKCSPRQGTMQLLEKQMEPTCLCHTVSHDTILCLNTRTGDVVLQRVSACRDNPPR
jgi:hypothetical protein